jgi:cholesterol transport system auxiliary component
MSGGNVSREAQHDHDNRGLRAARSPRVDFMTLRTNSFRSLALVLAITLASSACSILGKAEPIRLVDPQPHITADPAWPQVRWALLVLRPVANQSLDTDRIVVRPTPGALQVYKGAAWPDPAPDLVQTALMRGFEDSGRILSIARPGGAVRGDFQLATELRAFESVYEGATPAATIEVHARLIRVVDGAAVAAKTFRVSQASDGTDVAQVSDAFGTGLAQLTREVVGWSLAEGNRAGVK